MCFTHFKWINVEELFVANHVRVLCHPKTLYLVWRARKSTNPRALKHQNYVHIEIFFYFMLAVASTNINDETVSYPMQYQFFIFYLLLLLSF